MTREEAIEVMKAYRDKLTHSASNQLDGDIEAFDMAIKALEQEPSGDLISRTDAIEALGYDISIESDEGLDAYKTVIKEMICKIYDVQKGNIEKLPSVQPKPKTGHWIKSNIPNEKYVCSECGGACWYYDCQGNLGKSNYCPNCGAKMVEPQEE